MNVIFLGAPGTGKGTYAKEAISYFKIPHISTGDILRENIKEGSKLGLMAKTYIDDGKLVPDELVIKLVEDRLSKEDAKDGYILDGFPRTIPQAEELDRFASIDLAVNMQLDDETIIKRISGRRMCSCGGSYNTAFLDNKEVCPDCGKPLYIRDDDKPEVVKARLLVYYAQTAPLIDYYREKGILKEVDSSKDYLKVSQEIIELIKKI